MVTFEVKKRRVRSKYVQIIEIIKYLSMSQLCLRMLGNFVYLRWENINSPCMTEFRLPVKISIKWSSFVSARHKQVFISGKYFSISYQNILNNLLKSPSLLLKLLLYPLKFGYFFSNELREASEL